MNILFITIVKISDISDRGVYPDLMRKFGNEGHNVFILTPAEKSDKVKGNVFEAKNNISIIKISTFDIQKTNPLKKWFATLFLNYQYLKGIRRFLPGIKFDIILYSTPPITFLRLIKYIKMRDGSYSYLLLKDIFPQNAVDLGMIRNRGLIHSYYRNLEKKLYKISDSIGCMSQANLEYIIKKNPEINHKAEINPNSHELFDEAISYEQRLRLRNKYNVPENAVVFIYGGNLGKAQGIDFVIDFLDSQKHKTGVFFIIIGSGTEYRRIKSWFDTNKPVNTLILSSLPKTEYNQLLQSCDVGMIFLDNRFSVPNFPSRILSYMEYKLPVMAATDTCTDIGAIIVKHRFGLWSESGDLNSINQNLITLSESDELRETMGLNGYNYFLDNYKVDKSYEIIINHFNKS